MALLNMKFISRQQITWRVFWVLAFVSIGSTNFGVDLTWWSSALETQQFKDKYGQSPRFGQPKIIPSTWQSIGSGTPTAALACGNILGGFINAKIGRRMSIVVLAVVAIIGIILQVSIESFWGVIAGRIVNGISMGIEMNVIPIYSAELAPPAIRGFVVNLYQWWQIVGNIISAGCMYGTSRNLTDQWSYKTIMVVQVVIPTFLLTGLLVLPESPRWLLREGRVDEARKALQYLRKGLPETEDIVEAELQVLEAAVEEQKQLHGTVSFLDCFKGTDLRRTLIAVFVQCLQSGQGNGFMTTYYNTFLTQIGINNSQKWFIVSNLLQLVGITFSFYIPDIFGRRVVLFAGSFFLALLMYIVAGVASTGMDSDGTLSHSAAQGCIAAIILWYFFNGGCWGSCTWITSSEVPSNRLREKTLAIATFCGNSVGIVIQYVNPYVQNQEYANLGSKVGFIFGSVSVLSMVWVFFFLPELKGRSLEELDEMFEQKVPTLKISSYKCTGIGAQVTRIEHSIATGAELNEEDEKLVHVQTSKREEIV